MGGISVTELNVLEREFLAMIDWRLMVSNRKPHLIGRTHSFFPVYTRNSARILRQPSPNAQHRKIHTRRYTYVFQPFRERHGIRQ